MKSKEEDNAFVTIIDGGVGDTICSTAMIESAREFHKDKKIIVGAVYYEVLINNPFIDHLYPLTQLTEMYEKWVKPLKSFGSVRKRDIYNCAGGRLFEGKLSELWCKNYEVPYDGKDGIKLFITDEEDKEAKRIISSFERKVILIQPFGSRVVLDPNRQITSNKDWFVEYWIEIVRELTKSFDVVQVGGKFEKGIEGVTSNLSGQLSIRQTIGILKNSLTFISVDSLLGHASAAIGTGGIVLFGRSNPHIFGHDTNENIWVDDSCKFNNLFCCRPEGYFGDYELYRGQLRSWTCPHRSCMISITPEIVLNRLKKIFNGSNKD